MRKSIISIALVMCLLFSTVSVFAAIPGTMHMITIDGETYTLVEIDNDRERDVRVYDVGGILVEHMQYNKDTGVIYDVLRDEIHELQFSLNLLEHEIGDTDSEGYRFMGNYTVDLGYVYDKLSIVTIFVTYGVSISTATSLKSVVWEILEDQWEEMVEDATEFTFEDVAEEFLEYIDPTIVVEGELWMKTDNTYDYSKKVDDFYLVTTVAERFLYGPYITRQQKRNDI